MHRRSLLPSWRWSAALLLLAAACQGSEPKGTEGDFFERHIRPLLVDHCLACHGGGETIEGGLRLVSRQAILEGGNSGPAAVVGRPQESLLIEAVRYGGLEMPPDSPLNDDQIARLETWVALGLPWPENTPELVLAVEKAEAYEAEFTEAQRTHWAFQPLRRGPVPSVPCSAWPQSEIDCFVLAAHQHHGLAPSPTADKRTLIRRATFDLTGLPPRPQEIAAFLADESPEAFAKVVDRLLASPAYGERWGRYWLDVARYADTKGYVFAEDPNLPWAYTYRDYVVRALNEDLPYDQFILEQLAADQLPQGADRRSLAALGFITCGGVFLKNVQDIIDDRIDVVTRGILGLTVSCARCHDHKFDPIPTADYYSLYGVFDNLVEPIVPPLLVDPPPTEEYLAFDNELRRREEELMAYVKGKHAALVHQARTRAGDFFLAAHAQRGKPKTEQFMVVAEADELNPRMVAYHHATLESSALKQDPVFTLWHALADLPSEGFFERAQARLDEFAAAKDPSTQANPLVFNALRANPPSSMADVAERYSTVLASVDRLWQSEIAKAREAHIAPPEALADADQEQIRAALYANEAPANGPYDLLGYELLPDRASQAERKKLLDAVIEWRSQGPGAPPRAMAVADASPLREPYVFQRGNPNQRGRAVQRQFLKILSPAERKPFVRGAGRLELAQSLVDPSNPLTARVLVNRVWQRHFGAPLASSPSDFGLRSLPPSHPELLDALAATFMDEGWSIKKLHRRIMLSATYQQVSDDRPEMRRIDPENRFLWRFNRQRLDFEAMRDALLAVANRLDPAIGGESVDDIASAGTTRRTLYGRIDRFQLASLYRTFDFPSPDSSSPQRDPTTVPQQALFWINGPLLSSVAAHVRVRVDSAGAALVTGKVAQLYSLLFGRPPSAAESRLAEQFLGDSPSAGVWDEYVQGLLITNEFVFVD